jgi:hypothetical protein
MQCGSLWQSCFSGFLPMVAFSLLAFLPPLCPVRTSPASGTIPAAADQTNLFHPLLIALLRWPSPFEETRPGPPKKRASKPWVPEALRLPCDTTAEARREARLCALSYRESSQVSGTDRF